MIAVSNKKFLEDGFYIKKFENPNFISDIKIIIKKHFYDNKKNWNNASREEFHAAVLNCQNEINSNNLQQKIFESEKNIFKNVFSEDELLHESICFLRAVRPAKDGSPEEAVGFHRETMYSDSPQTKHCINIWFPVLNVSNMNTLRYIPDSHKIPEESITSIVNLNDPSKVEKFSDGHKLGFLYSPKKIISGVNLERSTNFLIPEQGYVAFSALLIHGAGQNYDSDIRFSISMAMIPKNKLQDNKAYFAADGNSHYVPFD